MSNEQQSNRVESMGLLDRYFDSENGYTVDADASKQEVELCRECSCGYDVYMFLTRSDLEKMIEKLNLSNIYNG